MDLLIQAVLDAIRAEMERLSWNKYQKIISTPFENSGANYEDDTFTVRSYYWGDDNTLIRLPNFKYKDFEANWYKHLHRGLAWKYKGEMGGIIPSEFLAQMLEDCFKSMEEFYKNDRL